MYALFDDRLLETLPAFSTCVLSTILPKIPNPKPHLRGVRQVSELAKYTAEDCRYQGWVWVRAEEWGCRAVEFLVGSYPCPFVYLDLCAMRREMFLQESSGTSRASPKPLQASGAFWALFHAPSCLWTFGSTPLSASIWAVFRYGGLHLGVYTVYDLRFVG